MTTCLCSHPRTDHPMGGKCNRPLCGCGSFRPRPSVAGEAEAWLASREGPGKDAAARRDGAA